MANHADDESQDEDVKDGIESFFDKNIGGGKGSAGDADDADDDQDEDDSESDDDEQDDADEDDADDDAGEEDEESDDDESEDDNEQDEDEDDEEEDDDEPELDPDVQAAAARHSLPTSFEDVIKTLPKGARAAARSAFQARLKEVESGLGRAFQEARAERKELARIKAERELETKNPADHIADLLDANPKLLEQLNEELDKRGTAAYAEAKKMTRAQAKEKLEQTAEAESQKQEARIKRGQQVATLAQRLAKDAGVPFKLVDKALFIAVMNSETKDVTDEAIRRIVRQEARDWQKLTGDKKREKKQEYIKSKTQGAKDAKKRVSARDRGHAPAPGKRREPKSLEEALTNAAARILPDAPSGR